MAIVNFNHYSACKRRNTEAILFLPTAEFDYQREGKETQKPWKVLWLLHGGGGDQTDFIRLSSVCRYAKEHRIAVVMPAGENFVTTDFEYVTEELPRLVRSVFPISDKAEDNMIGGLSFGGDCAMRAAMTFPERYRAALIMSAAGTEHRGSVEDAKLLFDVFGLAEELKQKERIPKLIFATGDGDRGFPYYTPVIDRLEAAGVPVSRHFVPGDGHSWGFWDDTVKLALDELFELDQ